MSGGNAPAPYQNAHNPAVDDAFAKGIASNTARTDDLYNFARPAYMQQVDQTMHNPGDATAMAGAWDVAGTGAGVGHNQIDRGNQEAGMGTGAIQSGWDPQSANYNWGLGQTKDAANVNAAEHGIAGSPFGAGATNNAMESFIRDWQAGTQQRQGAGIDQLNAINQGASADQGQGLQTLQASSLLPQSTYANQQQEQMTALNQLVQALTSVNSSSNQNLSSAANYLNTSTSQNNSAIEATKANNEGGGLLGGLGSLLSLGSSFLGPAGAFATGGLFGKKKT